MLFSTVNYDSKDIIQSYGMVDSHIVVGANLFRDVFSGFRDIFGGETKGYKKDIGKMKSAAMKELGNKASKMGANAVIALSVDLDEVSGGGKSMFMYNMVGTAVKLNEDLVKTSNKDLSESEILLDEFEDLKYLVIKSGRIQEIDDINIEDFEKFKNNGLLNQRLIDLYLKGFLMNKSKLDYRRFLTSLDLEDFEDKLLSKIDELNSHQLNKFLQALVKQNWFKTEKIIEMLKSDEIILRLRGLKFALLKKEIYTPDDISKYQSIKDTLTSGIDYEPRIEVQKKILEDEKLIHCSNCLNKTKLIGYGYCTNCGANKYGFNPKEKPAPYTMIDSIDDVLKELNGRLDTLRAIFKKE